MEGCSTLYVNQMIEPGPIAFRSNSMGEQSSKWTEFKNPINGWRFLECKNIKLSIVPNMAHERLISTGPPFIPLIPIFWSPSSPDKSDKTIFVIQLYSPKDFDLPIDAVDVHSALDDHKLTVQKYKFKDDSDFVISYSFEERKKNTDGATVKIHTKKLGCLDIEYQYIKRRHFQYMPVMEND